MKSIVTLIAGGLLLSGTLSGADPLKNPALAPVKIEKPARHEPLTLVKDGKLNFVIVCETQDEKPLSKLRQSVTAAAEALANGFQRTTGQRPKIVAPGSAEAKNAAVVIAVGKSALTDKAGIDLSKLPKEGFIVRTAPKMLIIAGYDGSKRPGTYNILAMPYYHINGTTNGAYDFLERFLGMRWYYPGIGVVAPKITDLTLPPTAYSDEPRYYQRRNYAYMLKFRKNWPWKGVKNDNASFAHSWRMGFSTLKNNACHSPRPDYLMRAYPDKKELIFYRDPSGHLYYNPNWGVGCFYDMCNPEFQKFMVSLWKRFYETNGKENKAWGAWYPPNQEFAIFGQCDTRVSLKNESNKHLFPDERKGDPLGQDSDLYAYVHSELARGLAKAVPGKRLVVLAYHYYTKPPLKYRNIAENLDIQVCMGRIILAKSPKSQELWKKTFKDWYDVLGKRKVTAWTYGSQISAFTKAIQGRYMKDYLKTVEPWLSKDGLFYDAGGLDWDYYYSYYPAFRAMWNPDIDVDAMMNEHWPLLYGPEAGAELKAFYDLLIERWEKGYIASQGQTRTQVRTEDLYRVYSAAVIEQLEKHLSNALAKTKPGSIERKRVEFFAKPWAREFTAARNYQNARIPLGQVTKLTNEKITLDGKLEEEIWQKAAPVTLRDAKGGDAEITSDPEMRMLWNSEGIWFGFSAKGKVTFTPDSLWKQSDRFELFLAPAEKDVYWQFAFSPEAKLSTGRKVEKPVEGPLGKWVFPGVKCKSSVQADSWTAELFIPFSALGKKTAPIYRTWYMNLVYYKMDPEEYASWTLTMGNNHNHTLWGKIRFLGKGD